MTSELTNCTALKKPLKGTLNETPRGSIPLEGPEESQLLPPPACKSGFGQASLTLLLPADAVNRVLGEGRGGGGGGLRLLWRLGMRQDRPS